MSQVVIHYSFDDPILGQTRVVSGKICGEKMIRYDALQMYGFPLPIHVPFNQ
jgi:hypothetical protein